MKAKMKVKTIARLAVAMLASCAAFRVCADVWNDGLGHDWTYKINGDSATITAVTVAGTMTAVSGEIVVPEDINGIEVTSFGQTFLMNTGITSVTIPSGVTNIQDSAFYECSSLVSVSLPDGLVSIGNSAFYRCLNLAAIDLPDSIESIGSRAFEYCRKLKDVRIPEKITVIEDYTFDGCGNLTHIDFPSELKSIGEWAFLDCYLESLELPDGLSEIGRYAFAACTGFTELYIPGSVKSINSTAFIKYSVIATLKHLIIGEGVEEIDGFRDVSTLESVVIPSTAKRIASSAFSGCELETVDFRSSALVPFATIFGGAKLRNITIAEDNPTYSCIDGVLYDKGATKLLCYPAAGKTESFAIPSTVREIDAYAFCNSEGLDEIILPQNLEAIGNRAFSGCSSLASLEIPGKVATLGEYMFIGCTNLVTVNIEDGNACFYSHDGIVYDSDNALVVCPPGRTAPVTVSETAVKIKPGAFYSCSRIPSVYVPSSVKEIGMDAFNGCESLQTAIIEPGITEIPRAMFSGCSSLAEFTIPQGVETIGREAFRECYSLKHIALPNGVRKIGDSAFVSCSALESIDLPQTLTEIGMNSFWGCDSLNTIAIPDSVTKLHAQCFMYCFGLETIIIGDGVKTLPNYSFDGCVKLKNIVFGKNVESIGAGCFQGCKALEEIDIPDTVKTIGAGAFMADYRTSYINSTLRRVRIGDGVTEIGNNAFEDCVALSEVMFGKNVKVVGSRAFSGCTSLPYVALPEGLEKIGSSAFYNCPSLLRVAIPSAVDSIGTSAFTYSTALREIVFAGDAPASVGDSAFAGVAPDCKGYVSRASTGWDVDIPGSWNAMTLDYIDKYFCVHLDVNGGEELSAPYAELYVEKGSRLGALPVPTRDNYSFLGWFTAAEGGDVVGEGSVISNDATLYAHWIRRMIVWKKDFEGAGTFADGFAGGRMANAIFGYEDDAAVSQDAPTAATRTLADGSESQFVQFTFNNKNKPVSQVFMLPERLRDLDDYELSFYWYAGSSYLGDSNGLYVKGVADVDGVEIATNVVTLVVPFGGAKSSVAQESVVNIYRGDDINDAISTNALVASKRGNEPALNPQYWYKVTLNASANAGVTMSMQGHDGKICLPETRLTDSPVTLRAIGIRVASTSSYTSYAGLDDMEIAIPEGASVPVAVEFSPNGGVGGVAALETECGSAVRLPTSLGIVRSGFAFAGWSDGDAIYAPGDEYRVWLEGGRLSAVWHKLPRATAFAKDFENASTYADGFTDGKLVNAVFGYVRDESGSAGACSRQVRLSADGASSHFAQFNNTARKQAITKYFTFPGGVQLLTDYEFTFKWFAGASWDTGYDCGFYLKGMADVDGVATLTNIVTVVVPGKSSHSGENMLNVYRGDNLGDVVSSGVLAGSTRGCAPSNSVAAAKYWYSVTLRGNRKTGVTLEMVNGTGSSALQETIVSERFVSLKCLGIRVTTDRYSVYGGLDDFAVETAAATPGISGDDGAALEIDSAGKYTIRPSTQSKSVVVELPSDVDASKVKVVVSPDVATVDAMGAAVRVARGNYDITEYLQIPPPVLGVVNVGAAEVLDEIKKEAMDVESGAEIDISPESPTLTTAQTRPGLTYTLVEGTTLEDMAAGDSTVGDGRKWTPNVTVKGGSSGFYTIKVEK